ncbi:DUF2264 domain-containing protein [Mucilaginibacter paludis]|uniref:Uncharacterized conserved protein UCP014753 n=1 Tax=Mucilaginibacter paludis DSM 18603 TaxID=714943 RepID=H1Y8J4_9SPHI|nr:DUF2264 domain-containing protein [Mucilaginibacter paludis]EHQ25912.1 Uncharacterized conserved protein UCP014753 [Mucilaginibacter paludis DSM 18603]
MRIKRIILPFLCLLPSLCVLAQKTAAISDRQIWLSYMDKVARPVMSNLAADKLKQNMPVELADHIDNKASRSKVAYLEAFGRTLCGLAPWLNLEGGDADEVKLRNQYREWALKAIANSVNPNAADYLQWHGAQPLVDASFVALGLIRCPWLWEHLDSQVKQQLIDALKLTRNTVPVYSNWLLFSGMIEAFFCKYDLGYDALRTDYGIREFTKHWYVGDGMYSDGMDFHFDYYNSIVIQPSLDVILRIQGEKKKTYLKDAEQVKKIGQRYAEILERLINTDGSYPATGRSIVYRAGVFHHLANMAYTQQLPSTLPPAQVRCALTAVIKKTLESPSTFNSAGWLNIGLYGKQPGLADFYITTGSLYICSEIFLPLGLPATDEFWSTPALPWTSVKVWSGKDATADHALDIKSN